MSRFARSRPSRVAIGVGAALAALLLAGCAAGQVTGTSTQRSSSGGAQAIAGDTVVQEAKIAFGSGEPAAVVHPAGSSAALQMRIINEGTTAEKLISVSSPFAGSVQVSGATDIPAGHTLVVGSTPGATPQPGVHNAQITMTGLVNDLRAGLTYPVTLVFQKAGPVTLTLPIDNPVTAREPAEE